MVQKSVCKVARGRTYLALEVVVAGEKETSRDGGRDRRDAAKDRLGLLRGGKKHQKLAYVTPHFGALSTYPVDV